MISFIVIGRNEGWRLSLCLKSIFHSVEINGIKSYEVLYIDSRSTDDSISRAKQYPDIRVFVITGKCNAAIARNIGGKEAQGDILIFLDGDMELQSDFIPYLFEENGELVYPFLSGIYQDYYYDKKLHFIRKEKLHIQTKNCYRTRTGGFFIIAKDLWETVGGMDTRLTVNEDVDLGLRILKRNIHPLKLAKIGVIHHTVSYMNNSRIWKILPNARFLAVLVRKHFISNRYVWSLIVRSHYTSVLLFIAIALSFFTYIPWLFYILIVLIRSMKRNMKQGGKIFFHFVVRDLLFVISFFLFFPKRPQLEYKKADSMCLTGNKFKRKLNRDFEIVNANKTK